MLHLPDSWVWDFWTADDGNRYHLFFLYASRALRDPNARHFRASVGHAVSDDLTTWQRVADALVHSDPPAFDEQATWTGSVTRGPDGSWFLHYTGLRLLADGRNVQSIGVATSPDLFAWTKLPGPVVIPDERWYGLPSNGDDWQDVQCRDPWVLADPDGDGWHMLFTARGNEGPSQQRGVVGHARSSDLVHWQVRPPLSPAGQGFAHLEVLQYAEVSGQGFLIFNALGGELGGERAGGTGGVWAARAAGPLGPYAIADAQQLTDDSRYVGKLVQLRDSGDWVFMSFLNESVDGFVGDISDPEPVAVVDGRLVIGPDAA